MPLFFFLKLRPLLINCTSLQTFSSNCFGFYSETGMQNKTKTAFFKTKNLHRMSMIMQQQSLFSSKPYLACVIDTVDNICLRY